jgi:hypothetical protein
MGLSVCMMSESAQNGVIKQLAQCVVCAARAGGGDAVCRPRHRP